MERTKTCVSCGVEKQLRSFEWRSDTQRHRNKCRVCNNALKAAAARRRYAKDPARFREKRREFYWSNPEASRAKALAYKEEHADRLREQNRYAARLRYRENPELYRERRYVSYVASMYGLTPNDIQELLNKQSGRCAICGENQARVNSARLHVDHCHQSGRVRGLLCNNCNIGIGYFGDAPDRLRCAAEYLENRS